MIISIDAYYFVIRTTEQIYNVNLIYSFMLNRSNGIDRQHCYIDYIKVKRPTGVITETH